MHLTREPLHNSLFDPKKLADLLNIPATGKPVAILCIGHVEAFYDKPMLEKEDWAKRKQLDTVVFDNQWDNKESKVKEA